MRYFIELKYDGAAYCGWQRQPDQPSVQQTIEQALTKLLRASVEIVGAGRTDTGVNASYYVAHFDCEQPFDCEQVLYKLNMMLPHDIAILSVSEVSDGAHARFDAREREYTYFISPRKNPFRRAAAWMYYVPLDVERMNEAAQTLMEFEDFTSFAKLNSNNKTNICHIRHAEWVRTVDVGRGRYTVEQFRAIVAARDLSRSSAGAPPQGLFLSDVVYDASVFEKRTL